MELQDFIKPELLVLVPVLYILGMNIKNSRNIDDRFIPSILGFVGVILSALWVIGTEGFKVIGVFTAITQGILVAGAAVYVNQLVKQSRKKKGTERK